MAVVEIPVILLDYAEAAEEGFVGASEIGADVCGSLFLMVGTWVVHDVR